MDEKIDKAIEILLDQVRTNLKPAEANEQADAILKMAQARQLLNEGKATVKKPGTSAS